MHFVLFPKQGQNWRCCPKQGQGQRLTYTQIIMDDIDLAKAKSEALENIYSLLKQNIKSCYAKRRRQRERWKNNNRSILQKKNFARAAHFFCTFLCRCFARLQRETSRNFLVTRFMQEMSYLFLFSFFHSLIFTLVVARISHFLTAAKKFSCSSSNKWLLIFRSSSLSLFFSLSFVDLSPTLFFLYIPNLWT